MPHEPARAAGFYGKIPARGDFVGLGLPPAVTRPWDAAISAGLAAARAHFDDRWQEVWLSAPVWRFALPADACGPAPLLGLWMPSVDRIERYFPLLLATTCPGAARERMAHDGGAWLDAAEDAGRAALAEDLSPEALAALIPPPPNLDVNASIAPPWDGSAPGTTALWWTDGAPLVPAHAGILAGLPGPAAFITMLDGGITA